MLGALAKQGEGPRRDSRLPDDFRTALDPAVRFGSSGRLAAGGSPWRVIRLGEAAMPFVSSLRAAGPGGAVATDEPGRSVARSLLDRGFAHPVVRGRPGARHDVDVVVPVFDAATALAGCLEALEGLHVIVVDDGSADPSAVRAVTRSHGATLERHGENLGPAAARNTGARLARRGLVAFVDADCRPQPGWLDRLVGHFEDPRVAAVAPRVTAEGGGASTLARYEEPRSALDMGRRAALVTPGGRLSFVPTAALVLRREVVTAHPFDEGLRFGEDVDLVWRLVDEGWLVRYEPAATVVHERPPAPVAWVGRRIAYGTSAGALARRHPGRLAPARLSVWSLASLLLAATGHPTSAAATSGLAAGLLQRRLAPIGGGSSMAVSAVLRGLVADAAALGHAFRREWWPVGAFALLAGSKLARPRSGSGSDHVPRAAGLVSGLMLAPLALEWERERPRLDPLSYVALRLLEDAAYGTGVAAGSLRARTMAPLVPQIRFPGRLARSRRTGAA